MHDYTTWIWQGEVDLSPYFHSMRQQCFMDMREQMNSSIGGDVGTSSNYVMIIINDAFPF